MNDIIRKCERLIDELRAECGELSFFALAQREESQFWDLLIAATWIEKDRTESLPYIVNKVQSILTKSEVLKLSGVILLQNSYFLRDSDDTFYKFEETNIDLYGVAVRKAYIFITPTVDWHSPKVRLDAFE